MDHDLDEELERILQDLGFCGCGNPEAAAEFMREGMQIIADQRKGPHYTRNAGRFDPEFEQWVKDHQARELAHFGSRGSAYFFYYWLCDKDLEEHGGSVPGWLTDTGEELLAKLTAWRSLPQEGSGGS